MYGTVEKVCTQAKQNKPVKNTLGSLIHMNVKQPKSARVYVISHNFKMSKKDPV